MVLTSKDVNAPLAEAQEPGVKDIKSMEYHRQVFQNKTAEETQETYISPSDTIMSPCSQKINALRNKHASKAKPKSLFAQASAKKLGGEDPFGAKSIQK